MLSISEKLNVFIEGLKGLKSLKRNGMKKYVGIEPGTILGSQVYL